jgi:hypothetical protein
MNIKLKYCLVGQWDIFILFEKSYYGSQIITGPTMKIKLQYFTWVLIQLFNDAESIPEVRG